MFISIRNTFFFIALVIFILSSCVPARKFEEVKAKQDQCEEDKAALKSENLKLNERVTELESEVAELNKRLEGLKSDTSVMGSSLRRLTVNYDKLNETYDKLLEQLSKVQAGNAADNKKLMSQLQAAKEDLRRREDELRELQLTLNKKEENLEEMMADQQKLQKELVEREKKVNELESILNKKDSTVNALKNKVAEALLGFKDNGLSVEMKNGKVYVSLEERLLFESGSWQVDSKGKQAIKQLGKVLETQPDVHVLIEGHTDTVPYRGSGQVNDNWDLSVMRATAIVDILTETSKINPAQLTAAGRGEHIPVATNKTEEGRRKNRRTEIIITPDLDELFQILESN